MVLGDFGSLYAGSPRHRARMAMFVERLTLTYFRSFGAETNIDLRHTCF